MRSKNDTCILLRLPKEDKVKLEALAWNHGRSTSRELRIILMGYLEEYEKKHGPIQRRGPKEPD